MQDYEGTSRELLACALRNSLYQGQWYAWQKKPRGSPLLKTPPERVVFFLQNHDQLANTLKGERLQVVAGHARARALTTFLLLLPQTPMLFMGQEFFSSSPFLFFVDHNPELQAAVNKGRNQFLSQFESARHAIEVEGHKVPAVGEAFKLSRLDVRERERNVGPLTLHREVLRLRREDPVFGTQDPRRLLGATLSEHALALRYLGEEEEGDRLLLLNLGTELRCEPCPEPLLAPIPGRRWKLVLSSDECRFGGMGADFPTGEGRWTIPGQCALVLAPEEKTETKK
jgi:maltooligosyltrehalose trehalohydrolase